jgi:TP901 family phage tail tape measure protein
MAIGVRELWLVVRMKDEASRMISSIATHMGTLSKEQEAAIKRNIALGSGLITLGAGITAVGAAGVIFFADATKAAIDYNNQAAYALTQVDNTKISLEDLKQVGRDVAAAIPAPFEQMQGELYNIFSSIDTNLAGAKTLLTAFAKVAVAGQVSMQEAGVATIGILNAYHMKVSQVNEVNDIMFQLVRKGVGTYGQFSAVIGRAVPSAVKAGQSIQTLAGIMAFLTRNGLSAANASASAARGLDALTNPAAIKNMEAIGIKVSDIHGRFLPVIDIIEQLHDKMKKLTQVGQNKLITDLFKGAGGTIQAKRFLIPATKDPTGLKEMIDFMNHSKGSLQSAYNIMFKQPQTQIQLFKNNLKILQTEIGDALIPILNRLAKPIIALFHWFNGLSDNTKKWITYVGAATAVILVVVGVLVMFAGALLVIGGVLSAVAGAIGISVAALIGFGAVIFAVVAVVVAAIILIWKYHKQIWDFLKRMWQDVKDFTIRIWNDIYNFMKPIIVGIWNFIVAVFTSIADFFVALWNGIYAFFEFIWNSNIVKFFRAVLYVMFEIWLFMWKAVLWVVINIWDKFIWPYLQRVWKFIVLEAKAYWKLFHDYILQWVLAVWNWLEPQIAKWWEFIHNTFTGILNTAKAVWAEIHDAIINPTALIWSDLIYFFNKILGTISDFFGKAARILSKIGDALSHLDPFSHHSPSLVEQTDKGFALVTHNVTKHLSRLHTNVRRFSRSIRNEMALINAPFGNGLGPAQVGGFTTPSMGAQMGTGQASYNRNNQITIYTQEIDPRLNAAQLGWELDRRSA